MTLDQQTGQLIEGIKPAEEAELARRAIALCMGSAQEKSMPGNLATTVEIAGILANELIPGGEPVAAVFLKAAADAGLAGPGLIGEEFGKNVVSLVSGLQKIDRLDKRKTHTNVENFIRLLLTISDDIRVILIHLAEKLYAMRHLQDYTAYDQEKLAAETVMLYIPIAHRIGLYRVKTELEELVMQYREPEQWSRIEESLRNTQAVRDRYAKEFIRPIARVLKENNLQCEIKSRIKSIPSINRKMEAQKVDFDKVYDIFAIRIILDNTLEDEKSDCWKVYSLVTDIYTPNPRRLRDWISFPKSNGYESLHTTVIGPEGRWVEVQIRTRRMDDIAEKGFAAHWKYKSDRKDGKQSDLYTLIREMLERPGKADRLLAYSSSDKEALYTDEIFIFTPQGDLKKLKAGYTVLDFAFEVHTKIGATCTGAIVNGKMVPLKHVLQNGDTVRILTSRTQKPNAGWLEIVKSPRNQARVKHALKMETYKESEAGKEIIKNKVLQLGHEFTDVTINKLVEAFGCENYLDLYQKFGEGKLDPLKIKKALAEADKEAEPAAPSPEETFHGIPQAMTGQEKYLVVNNMSESFHYQFAHCCNPVPGSKIFAFISVSQGIRIHRTSCPNAKRLITRYPYRIMEARWK